ncbi:MAG TPA: HAD family hydrolase [Gemmatimonadales bacterium]|nr:HAD family hydrolase [Gemmatimonadales bacterium]
MLENGRGRRAAFLDRDGTILVDPAYLHQPERVRFFPGAAEAVGRLNAAGYVVVSVSNQSGIARGMYGEAEYYAVMRRLNDLLADHGARLDGSYFCPHHPTISGPCECRKPGLKLFRDAQAAHGIDFTRSVFVGDRLSDVEPARHLGGTAFLVETGRGAEHVAQARVLGVPVVADLAAAVEQIVRAP